MKWNPFERLYWPLFLTTLFMSLLGAVMVYSAAAPDSSESFAVRQLVWIGMGIIAMFFILLMSYRNILNMSYVFYVLGLVMLAGVLVLGHTRMGAQRWIALGPFVLQPSEFFKIILILTLAHYLGNSEKNLYQLARFFMCFFITVIPLVLVLKQPDLGTALIFLPILFCLLFVWGARLRFFLITFSLGLASLPFLWHMLHDYQKKRLLVFINPNADPLGAGYTAIQSKIAVGAGGLWGKGWMQGTQNKLDFLPEHHTDFIFGVIGEEFGFIGSCLLMAMFALYIYYALRVIQSTTDQRAKLLATGVVVMFVFHIVINIGMTIGLMPIAGLPLPFISYGGSAMITFYIATGLLLSIYRERSIF